jgi:hypothetical protein
VNFLPQRTRRGTAVESNCWVQTIKSNGLYFEE